MLETCDAYLTVDMNVVDLPQVTYETLEHFSEGTRTCIERLLKHGAERHDLSVSQI